MYCPNCGKDSAPNARFCESCGTALPADPNNPASGQQNNQTPPPYGQQQPYGQPMFAVQPQLKNAGLAAVLSFLLAGLGYIYLGLITKGIVYIILYIVLWGVGVAVAIFTYGLGLLIPVIFWLWQIYDTYKKANEYNAALQQTGRAPW